MGGQLVLRETRGPRTMCLGGGGGGGQFKGGTAHPVTTALGSTVIFLNVSEYSVRLWRVNS